jgi:hypothetical protein
MKINKTITVSFVLLSILALLVPMAFADTKPIVKQVTGGGWILASTSCEGEISKKTFGFNAEQLEDGTVRGNVEFVDHDPFGGYERGYPHVHGYEIDTLTIVGNEATITGMCRLNGDPGPYAFTVVVRDEAEPGKHDWFEITIPAINYHAAAELGFDLEAGGGGNIQVHVPAP